MVHGYPQNREYPRQTHESEVSEIRNWVRSTKKHLAAAAVGEDIGTSAAEAVLSPLLVMEPVKLKLARTMPMSKTERLRELIGKANTRAPGGGAHLYNSTSYCFVIVRAGEILLLRYALMSQVRVRVDVDQFPWV